MKVTDRTRESIAFKRQRRRLLSQGYICVDEPIWEIVRGGDWDKRIIAVEISSDGKSLYCKLSDPD